MPVYWIPPPLVPRTMSAPCAGVYGMPRYWIPPPLVPRTTMPAGAAPAELQPWSYVTAPAGAGAEVSDDGRATVATSRSPTARMRAPTATPSWRRSGVFETVRGAADIGCLP